MATQLKQMISVVALAGGATLAYPHNLNWNGRPVVPDVATPSIADVNGDLEILSATDTDITIINNGAAPVTAVVYLESWHTAERAFGAVQTVALSPQPFVPRSGGGGGAGAGTQYVFVFYPDGVAAGNVYTDWETLWDATQLVEGFKIIEFTADDESLLIVSAGDWDMTDVTWRGDDSRPDVIIADGCTLPNLTRIENLNLASQASLQAPITLSGTQLFLSNVQLVLADEDSVLPIIEVLTGGAIYMTDGSSMRGDDGVPILLVDAGISAFLYVDARSFVRPKSLGSGAGATIRVQTTQSASLSLAQPDSLGTIEVDTDIVVTADQPLTSNPRFPPNVIVTEDFVVSQGRVNQVDSTAGPIAASMTTDVNVGNNNAANSGLTTIIKLVAGANDVTITADGTIDGAATYVLTGGTKESVVLVADGGTNWIVVASHRFA